MFARMTGNIWVSSHAVSRQGITSVGGGRVDLGATLDRFRVTRVGTDTFDAGSFVLKWRR
jgi:hypothetical protein